MVESLVRLHISPFDPTLLPTVLGGEASKLAVNITFHTLQTFPENTYGYVDLPLMAADKVKKKMNGAILKGKKMKVEDARPNKRKRVDEKAHDTQPVAEDISVPVESKKRSKRDRGVLLGHELSPEREVKRGWTKDKPEGARKKKDRVKSGSKQQAASKYSEKKELLFRTKTPKSKTSISDQDAKKKRRKVKGDTQIVHEFENSTNIPSFLRTEVSHDKQALTYEDGKGWVDAQGKIVEEEDSRALRRRTASKRAKQGEKTINQSSPNPAPVTKSPTISGDSFETPSDSADTTPSDTVEDENVQVPIPARRADDNGSESDETSSSGSSDSDTSPEPSSEAVGDPGSELSTAASDQLSTQATVHPLEALFKKPVKPASSQAAASSQDIAKPSLEVQTSFSFFEHSPDTDNIPPMPMTPFSSQDLSTRGVRSAAPTPDTAFPSRMGSIFDGEESDGELSEMGDEVNPNDSSHSLQLPQTEFEKQFWEKRGENNRAWKARRRAVLKEKRQRENRARRPKNW